MASAIPSLEESIRSAGFASLPARPVGGYAEPGDPLEAALAGAERWLPGVSKTLSGQLPVPKTVAPFVTRPFFRPPGSYRSFYYGPSTLAGVGSAAGKGVVAIKGLEPCLADVDALFDDLRRACYSPHNVAEHFVFVEHKIPACLGLNEALREAERAAAIQRLHLRHYGALARLPLPLLVHRHSDDVLARMTEKLSRLLGTTAFREIEPMLGSGLGAYAYYYPTAPLRVRDIDQLLHGLSFQDRLLRLLGGVCDPEHVINRWVCGFVRMLFLGFLPGSLASLRSGICCQPQNACVDGGFVDLDSLTPLDELRDDTAVAAALQFSVESLLQTVGALAIGGADAARDGREVRTDLHHLWQYVLGLIDEAIKTEARPGLELDARIRRYFTAPRAFEDLVARLRSYYSPRSAFDSTSQEFHQLGGELMKSARES